MAEIAHLYSYDPNYFCRLFRKSVGVSYKDYVRSLKLDYGMKLVRFTDLSITEIAANCGYETQTHFNREFKAHYKASPSSFRK
jgi:AraC-like DNA-binding protein